MSEYPDKVARLKPSLRAAAELDVSDWKIPGKRGVTPYEGECVWLDPYIDSATERELVRARDELGEDPDNEEAFEFMCERLDELVWGWNLTDKFGEALPQPGEPGVWDAVPSWFVAHLLTELAGAESEGEGPSGSGASTDG